MVTELLQLAQLPLGRRQGALKRFKSKSYPPLLSSSDTSRLDGIVLHFPRTRLLARGADAYNSTLP